jgi:polyadenylate-binding protein
LFESFGDITSAVIMRDENGVSKGYGFVCFSRPDDAFSALQTLNSQDGLYVSEAKDKA